MQAKTKKVYDVMLHYDGNGHSVGKISITIRPRNTIYGPAMRDWAEISTAKLWSLIATPIQKRRIRRRDHGAKNNK